MARPKPFSDMHLRRVAGPDSGGGALTRVRGGDFGPKRRGHGRGFGFELRPWLTISAERVRSLNPCVVRTLDEYTKRTALVSGQFWRIGDPSRVPREHRSPRAQRYGTRSKNLEFFRFHLSTDTRRSRQAPAGGFRLTVWGIVSILRTRIDRSTGLPAGPIFSPTGHGPSCVRLLPR